MKESKKPKRLRQMLKTRKLAKPKLLPKAKPTAAQTATPIKPTKDRKLVRFRKAFAKQQPISEAKAYDAELAGTSVMVIDKDRTNAELKTLVDGFATDCIAMSNDGHTVIAISVAYD